MSRPEASDPPLPPAVARRKVREAARLWGLFTLGGISVLSALTIWHLIRRGRLIRSRQPSPRDLPPLSPPPNEPDDIPKGSIPS